MTLIAKMKELKKEDASNQKLESVTSGDDIRGGFGGYGAHGLLPVPPPLHRVSIEQQLAIFICRLRVLEAFK